MVDTGLMASKNPVRGLDAWALSLAPRGPERYPMRPACTASLKGRGHLHRVPGPCQGRIDQDRIGPISRASAACEGRPRPASTTTGTVACSMMISRAALVRRPWLEPMGLARGMTVAVPTSASRRPAMESALI